MRLNIILHTSEFRGDHAADVAAALSPIEGQSVEDLAIRNLTTLVKGRYDVKTRTYPNQKITASNDWIEIRVERDQSPIPQLIDPKQDVEAF